MEDQIIALLKATGFAYIEYDLLHFLGAFSTEVIERLVVSLERVSLFLYALFSALMRQSLEYLGTSETIPLFLAFHEVDNEIYFNTVTQDGTPVCVLNGTAFSMTFVHYVRNLSLTPDE